VRIFDMPSGRHRHTIREHTDHVHVLEAHPTIPQIAVSASYDGQLALWDVEKGIRLNLFSRCVRAHVHEGW
jgi:WD40 repeat protein